MSQESQLQPLAKVGPAPNEATRESPHLEKLSAITDVLGDTPFYVAEQAVTSRELCRFSLAPEFEHNLVGFLASTIARRVTDRRLQAEKFRSSSDYCEYWRLTGAFVSRAELEAIVGRAYDAGAASARATP